MTQHRFFVHPEWLQENRLVIQGDLVHQIRNVLRMRPGDRIIALDNSGWEYQVGLDSIEKDAVTGQILQKTLAPGEPRTKIRLYQGVLRGRNLEWVLQKGTELGIVEFVPLISDRCLMSSLDDISAAKITRWQRIILEAAEQSRRGRLPRLQPPLMFSQACEQTRQEGLALMPWEGEHQVSLQDVLGKEDQRQEAGDEARSRHPKRRPFALSLIVGPEGGFTDDEAALARRYGIRTLTLGPRVLRAETAGLVAAAAILYEFGDLA